MTEHLQINDVAPRIQYDCDGVQAAYIYPFAVFRTADLEVWQDGVRVSSGFSVSGAGISSGGVVVFAVPPAQGSRLTLRRRVALERISDFQTDGIIRAKTLNDELDYQVAAVQQAVSPLPKQKVLLQVGASPLFSSVRTSFTNDFIELGGGINIAGEQRSGAMKTEQVLALNPEVIIIAVMGSEHGIGADEKQRWLQFATIDAVRHQRVHLLDPDAVCSPSPLTFADTLITFARLIHPEVVIQLPTPSQP